MVFEDGMRIDKWLWFARLSPSRTQAQKMCESRHLRLDGRVIQRSCTLVRPGAVISYFKDDRVVAVRVEALTRQRTCYSEARLLYTSLLPNPDPRTHAQSAAIDAAT